MNNIFNSKEEHTKISEGFGVSIERGDELAKEISKYGTVEAVLESDIEDSFQLVQVLMDKVIPLCTNQQEINFVLYVIGRTAMQVDSVL